MTKTTSLLLSAVFVLAACGGDAEVAPIEETPMSPIEALPNMPLPPDATPIRAEAGGDAAQLLFATPMHVDDVVKFYRAILSEAPYSLLNEAEVGGATTFYVEQDGPPLWVMVEGFPAGGTQVRLTGADITKVDSSGTDSVTVDTTTIN